MTLAYNRFHADGPPERTETNLGTCMWSGNRIEPSSGLIRFGWPRAVGLAGPRSDEWRRWCGTTPINFEGPGMSTLPSEPRSALAQQVTLTEDTLVVDLVDGRTVSVPLLWYPRLAHGTPAERANWRLIGRGEGIHWPDLDEDISVAGLLAGRPSGETQTSLRRWLESRQAAR